MGSIHQDCAESVKDLGIQESEDLCDDIDGMPLSFESGYEMFGSLQNQPRYHCDDGGMGELLIENNTSVTESNITHIESAMEVLL